MKCKQFTRTFRPRATGYKNQLEMKKLPISDRRITLTKKQTKQCRPQQPPFQPPHLPQLPTTTMILRTLTLRTMAARRTESASARRDTTALECSRRRRRRRTNGTSRRERWATRLSARRPRAQTGSRSQAPVYACTGMIGMCMVFSERVSETKASE